MKKIVFCLQTMTLGGVEKELITVLKHIHDRFDVSLLLLHQEDEEILAEIPSDVKILRMNVDRSYYYGSTASLAIQRVRRGKVFEAASLALKRFFRIGTTGANTNLDDIPALPDRYDVAVCYHIHSPLMLRYTAEKIQADKKVAWIHNDFYTTGYPIQRLKRYVMPYHEFVAVSKKVEQEFRTLCPWYPGCISTAYNYLDSREITTLAQETIDNPVFESQQEVKILTVGRFAAQKGIDLAIEVCAMLKRENLGFHWFLIGYGELEDTYRQLIKQHGVEDCFTILGKKKNPYPYMQQCDICVQPSRHEAYPLVIMEAKILRKPIVCTNFDGADEQIENGRTGIIVQLNDTAALCREIAGLIRSPESRHGLSKALGEWNADDDLSKIIEHFEI